MSLKLGKVFGISVELHSTFIWLILIAVILLAVFTPANFFPILILIFFLFFSVFLHELVHSIVAVEKGFSVQKIILLPIGGVSVTDDLPEAPKDEFLIAVAGPAFNFAVVFLIIFFVFLLPLPFPQNIEGVENAEQFNELILKYPLFGLLWVNLILGAFNLFIPALPLDGGRVLRSLLAIKFGFNKATHFISKISTFIAIFLFILGFLAGNLILAIIAVFIYLGSHQENDLVVIKEVLRDVKLESVVDRKPTILDSELTLEDAFEAMVKENQLAFLVEKKQGFGVIDVEKLEKVEKSRWMNISLEHVCERVPQLKLDSKSSEAFSKVLIKGFPLLPVFDGKELVGIVKAGDLQKLFELKKLEKMK